jgi:hypothetical protein
MSAYGIERTGFPVVAASAAQTPAACPVAMLTGMMR